MSAPRRSREVHAEPQPRPFIPPRYGGWPIGRAECVCEEPCRYCKCEQP